MIKAIFVPTQPPDTLAPLTDAFPQPLLPIGNQPLLALAIAQLARAGIKQMRAALPDRASSVAAHFGDGARWGVSLSYDSLPRPLAHTTILQRSAAWLDGPFVLMPLDAVVQVDWDAALAYHRAHDGALTLIVDGRSRQLLPGCAIGDPALLATVPPSVETLTDLAGAIGQPVRTFTTDRFCCRLDSFAAYHHANQAYLQSDFDQDETTLFHDPVFAGHAYAPGVYVGRNPAIHPSVKIVPPVCIGDGCRVGRNVELGPGAILGQNVIVDDDATVSASVILDNTYVGQLVNVSQRLVHQSLLIDPAGNEMTEVVDRFLLTDNSPVAVGNIVRRNVDAALAAVLLVLLFLPGVLLALISWLATGRPLTRETAVGTRPWSANLAAGRHTFTLLRFSTARADGTVPAWGRWLRRTDLDRLPQLWAVFTGHLSMVGVMPLPPETAVDLTEAWQTRRFEFPAGLTGLWYVQGQDRGTLDDVLISDAFYVSTRSWREDARLLWQTPAAWWRRRAHRPAADAPAPPPEAALSADRQVSGAQ